MRFGSTRRGLQPKVTSDTLVAYTLNRTASLSVGEDLLSTYTLGQHLSEPLPANIDALCGNGKSFNGTTQIMATAGDAAARDAMETDWTVGVWIRLREEPTGTDVLFGYSGNAGNETSAHNVMMSIRITSARKPDMFWENGAGDNVTTAATDAVLRKNIWTYLVWRKSLTTEAGPEGTCTLELFINGHLIETFAGVENTAGGSSAFWMMGAKANAAGSQEHFLGDICGAHVEKTNISDDEITENFRRGMLLTVPTTTHHKVEIENPAATLQDMGDLESYDWVDSVSMSDRLDDPVKSATPQLHREIHGLSLATLKTDSMLNLTDLFDLQSIDPQIDIGRKLVISAARVPLGLNFTSLDLQEIFRGEIDDVDWSNDIVKINSRDQGADLVDTYIEEIVNNGTDDEPFSYGSETGISVDIEMQRILNDNDNTSTILRPRIGSYAPIALETPVDPGWEVKQWNQRRESVMTALRNLAGQIGWEVRFRFNQDPSVDAFELQFYEPERTRLDVDAVLVANDLMTINRVAVSRMRVRNAVEISWPSSNVKDQNEKRLMETVFAEDTASLTKFGRRFMGIQEASTSIIDEETESERMRDAILADLKDPLAEINITIPLFFEVETNDIVKLIGDNLHYTGDQVLSVVSVTHNFGRDDSTTTLELRGKPRLGEKRWLELETRPGMANPGVKDPGESLRELLLSATLSQINNFSKTDFLAGGKFVSVKNSTFSMISRGPNFPPDGWRIRPIDEWTVDFEFSDISVSGGRSVKFLTDDIDKRLQSELIPVSGNPSDVMAFDVTYTHDSLANPVLIVIVAFINAAREVISAVAVTLNVTITPGTFVTLRSTEFSGGVLEPVSGTEFIRLAIVPGVGSSGILLDSISLYRLAHQSLAAISTLDQTGGDPTFPVLQNTWTQVRLDDEVRDYGQVFNSTAAVSEFEAKETGEYIIVAQVTAFVTLSVPSPNPNILLANVKLQKDNGTGFSNFIIGPASTFAEIFTVNQNVTAQLTARVFLNSGDKINMHGILDFTGGGAVNNFGFRSGVNLTYLSVRQSISD